MPQLYAFVVTFRRTPHHAAQSWTRFYPSQEAAEADAPKVVHREFPNAVMLTIERVSDPRGEH